MSQTVGLTTLERLRMHVLRDKDDESADDKLIEYGEAGSELVADYCEREFLPDPASADDDPIERVFLYDGSGTLDLAPSELRSLVGGGITLNEGSGPRTLAATEYRLNPRGKSKQGTYLSLDLPLPRFGEMQYGFEWTVAITGRFGMAAVPKMIELAVWIFVDNTMDNPGSHATQQLGGYNIVEETPAEARGGLPLAAWRICNRFKRQRRVSSVVLRRPHVVSPRWPRDDIW